MFAIRYSLFTICFCLLHVCILCNAISVSVDAIKFHGSKTTIYDENAYADYPSPEWTLQRNCPVLYPRNEYVSAFVTLTLSPSTYSGDLFLWGYGPGNIIFLGAVTVSQGGTFDIFVLSSNRLPNYSGYDSNFEVDWWYSTSASGMQTFMRTTSNPMYRSLAPLDGQDSSFRTVIHIACAGVNVSTSEDAKVAIWNKFSGPANITTWDGDPLKYYEQGYTFAQHDGYHESLIVTGRGQCGSFQDLLASAWSIHNFIWFNYITVHPTYEPYMLIDHMYPVNMSWPIPNYPFLILSNLSNTPEMQPAPPSHYYGDLYSISGLAGQNSTMPGEKWFGVHFILKDYYGSTYYDPSYGSTYSSSSSFVTSSVFGVGTLIQSYAAGIRYANSKDITLY